MIPDAPREAKFDEFTVRRCQVPGQDYWYEVHLAENVKHLIRPPDGRDLAPQPGWLGAIRFPSYEEAVAFGKEIAPVLRKIDRLKSEANRHTQILMETIARRYVEQDDEV